LFYYFGSLSVIVAEIFEAEIFYNNHDMVKNADKRNNESQENMTDFKIDLVSSNKKVFHHQAHFDWPLSDNFLFNGDI
jgi:hypothetical protein